jgi:hypothetical protein
MCLAVALVGCSKRRRSEPEVGPMHPAVAPLDYGWIREAFAGHPWLRLVEVKQRDHSLPGRIQGEVRLGRLQPQGLVRRELERISRTVVAPDPRALSATWVVRGLGDVEYGVLIGNWRRGQPAVRWHHPAGPGELGDGSPAPRGGPLAP